jgi:hypothetical protein
MMKITFSEDACDAIEYVLGLLNGVVVSLKKNGQQVAVGALALIHPMANVKIYPWNEETNRVDSEPVDYEWDAFDEVEYL